MCTPLYPVQRLAQAPHQIAVTTSSDVAEAQRQFALGSVAPGVKGRPVMGLGGERIGKRG